MKSKESLDGKTYNELTAAGVLIGIFICFYGVFSGDASIVTAGVTFVLAAVTAHYAYTTKRALEISSETLELMNINQRKPRIEDIANNFFQPILKYSESGLAIIQKNLPIVHVHPINTNIRLDAYASSLNVFDKLILELIEPFNKILEYQILKKTQNIDPSYPDLTFKKNFPIFESEMGKIIDILDQIKKKLIEFGSNESSIIDSKYNFEEFKSRFGNIYELNLSSKNYLLSKLFNEIFLCNNSISIYYEKGDYGYPVLINDEAEFYSVIDEVYQQYYIENKERFIKEKEEFYSVVSDLEISLEKITSQLNQWINDWINEYSIVIGNNN